MQNNTYWAEEELNAIAGEFADFIKVVPNGIVLADPSKLTVTPDDVVDVLQAPEFHASTHKSLKVKGCYVPQ